MDPVKEKIVDVLLGVIIIVILVAVAWEKAEGAESNEVYMQLFTEKQARAPVRTLFKDSRMTLEECQKQKAKVEAPLNAGGGYSIPSGWVVECIPVEYLDD